MTTRTCPNCQKPTMQIAVFDDEQRWVCKACHFDDGQVYGKPPAWLPLVVFAAVAVLVIGFLAAVWPG